MVREIRKLGDPVLRRKAKKVEKVTKETQKLIDDMLETMRAANGAGLAAPQVGVSQRVAVVEIEKKDDVPGSGVVYALVNPEVVKHTDETWVHAEGCLSIPGWRGEVERPVGITLKAMDRDGNRFKLDLEGWVARAILHEVDHLEGVMYIDKLTAPDRIWRVEEGQEEEEVMG